MKKLAIYSRQSKVSGLKGQMTLETADFTVRHYLNTLGVEGIDYEVVARFQEIKSGYGKNSRSREEFNKAIDFCRENKDVVLVVPNIQRFSRNTAHGATILEEINVVLANNPHANKTMKNLLLVMGEDESYQQSNRRKATYQAKKERCDRLGVVCEWGANSTKYQEKLKEGKIKHVSKRTSNETTNYWEQYRPQIEYVVESMKSSKIKLTYANISSNLNKMKITSRGGKELNPAQTQRILDKLNISRV